MELVERERRGKEDSVVLRDLDASRGHRKDVEDNLVRVLRQDRGIALSCMDKLQ